MLRNHMLHVCFCDSFLLINNFAKCASKICCLRYLRKDDVSIRSPLFKALDSLCAFHINYVLHKVAIANKLDHGETAYNTRIPIIYSGVSTWNIYQPNISLKIYNSVSKCWGLQLLGLLSPLVLIIIRNVYLMCLIFVLFRSQAASL